MRASNIAHRYVEGERDVSVTSRVGAWAGRLDAYARPVGAWGADRSDTASSARQTGLVPRRGRQSSSLSPALGWLRKHRSPARSAGPNTVAGVASSARPAGPSLAPAFQPLPVRGLDAYRGIEGEATPVLPSSHLGRRLRRDEPAPREELWISQSGDPSGEKSVKLSFSVRADVVELVDTPS